MRTRTESQELTLRCDMVDGDLLAAGEEAAEDIIGTDRRASMPPIPRNMNLMSKFLSVVAKAYDRAAVTGLDPQVAAMIRSGSSPVAFEAYKPIKAIPYPTSLLTGDGKHRGLRQVLAYLCGCGHGPLFVGYAPRSKRLYAQAIRSDRVEVTYAEDDPTEIVKVRWTRSRTINKIEQDTIDEWDISNPKNPTYRILAGDKDITAEILPDETKKGKLAGSKYWWRFSDGTPYIPIVIYGCPRAIWEMSYLSEGVRASLAYRLCFAGVMVDSGFPTNNVRNLKVASTTDSVTGQATVSVNRGDTIHWSPINDIETSEHWTDPAGGDPMAMLQAIHADEQDTVSQLGFPLVIESTGGAPAEAQIEAQIQAAERYFDICRVGDYQLFKILSAMANRLSPPGWTQVKEDGFGSLYGREIDAALKAEREKTDGADQGRTRGTGEASGPDDQGRGRGAGAGEDPGPGESEEGA